MTYFDAPLGLNTLAISLPLPLPNHDLQPQPLQKLIDRIERHFTQTTVEPAQRRLVNAGDPGHLTLSQPRVPECLLNNFSDHRTPRKKDGASVPLWPVLTPSTAPSRACSPGGGRRSSPPRRTDRTDRRK